MMEGSSDLVRDMANAERAQRPTDGLDFDEFCSVVATALDTTSSELQAATSIVDDLGLDELSLANLVMAIQDLNPYFQIPDQVNVHQVTLPDLYHFYCVMSRGHVEGEPN